MRISDWGSDVCSSDLRTAAEDQLAGLDRQVLAVGLVVPVDKVDLAARARRNARLFDRFHGAGQSRFQPEAFKADTVTELERDVGIAQQIAFRLCARIIANHHLLAAGRDTAIDEPLRRAARLRFLIRTGYRATV